MPASFLAAHCGIVVEDFGGEHRRLPARSWINALHGDARLLMTAASAADKAANFLLKTEAKEVEISEEMRQAA